MELNAYAPGIYPRSEALVQATRDLDRGRTTADAVEAQVKADQNELVRAQEEAGLTLLSDGLLRWQDLFRPLAERATGLDARPLTRFLDTNTFYRALLVEGDPRLRDPVPPPPDLPAGRWLGTLPSPTALSHATRGEASAHALAAEVLAPQIQTYAEGGCALVVLSDPFLAESDKTAELVSSLGELAEAPVTAVGIDFYATSLDAIPESYPKEIMAGVIDSRSSALEDPAEIGRFAGALAERKPAGISLSPNGDLQFVPEAIARRK